MGVNGECLAAVGLVVGVRVHELALFAPGSEGWFARFGTTSTRSSAGGGGAGGQGGVGGGYDGVPRPMLV
jgi:hypothetical protein